MGLKGKRNGILRVAAIGLLAGAVAGCSSGFTRFDENLYTSSTTPGAPANQPLNPYPGDVDTTTTASVDSNRYGPTPHPVNDVTAIPDHGGYDPATADAARQSGVIYQPAQQPAQVQRADLSAPTVITAPQTYPAATDNVTTSSVIPARIPPQNRPPATAERGWTATNGIPITLGQGETVHNLSKRYGVPVNAILKANSLSDPAQVKAGQTIIIPTYVYGADVPVSAPDNDPKTRYASANRGALYAPDTGRVPVPQPKPLRVASSQPVQPQPVAAQPVDPVVTGATSTEAPARKPAYDGGYAVKNGDTLSKIAAAHGVTVAQLRAANNLTGDSLRIGQQLAIPQAGSRVAAVPPGVDPIVTGVARPPADKASPGEAAEAPGTASTAAPAQTGIGEFRWPVRGRVIANFGDKTTAGRNDGIDISVPEGTAVKAAENGVVVYAGSELEGFGNLILIRHSDGWVSAYAHNKTLEVKRGEEVRRGQTIARSGRSGNAEMPKLHFELRRNSVPVDPLKHLGAA